MALNRPSPRMPPALYRTYQIAAPAATHMRRATCAEAECEPYRLGWTTTVDATTDLGARQAFYIRKVSGRGYREEPLPGGMVRFTFTPGQPCFASDSHRVPIGRPELFIVREGDWRGNPRGIEPRVLRAPDWVDHFANHQDRIATAIKEG